MCKDCTDLAWDPCRNGCHDSIPFSSANEGIELLLDLIEAVANDDLAAFHAFVDVVSGKDGVEEASEIAQLLLLDEDETNPEEDAETEAERMTADDMRAGPDWDL